MIAAAFVAGILAGVLVGAVIATRRGNDRYQILAAHCTDLEVRLEVASSAETDQVRRFWMSVADRNADEAQAYARQLRHHHINPNASYGHPEDDAA